MSIDYNSNIYFTIKEKSLDSFKFNKFIKKINRKNDIKMNNWNIIYNIPYHSHLNPIDKELFIKKYNDDKDKVKKEKLEINKEKNNDYKLKYQNKIKELNINFEKLNILMNEKRKIEKEKMIIFKGKNNENLKVDDMSKKH